tara:strand:- start:4206 stop:4655 length:450 start_codon:yes stop_codon:yes gene_type:complete
MDDDNKYNNSEEFKEFGEVVKDSYLLSLGLIQSFVAKGQNMGPNREENMMDYIASYGDLYQNPQLILGSVLSHCKFLIDICAESMGLTEEDMIQHYAYHFYANILPDIEYLFSPDLDKSNYDKVIKMLKDTGMGSIFNLETEDEDQNND